ncbi:MAG: hypothetical protein H0V89_04495 [Deltaproteobacteria bacterium]|nr:hypothetical protein [Deltaproteobacteria bacterium]
MSSRRGVRTLVRWSVSGLVLGGLAGCSSDGRSDPGYGSGGACYASSIVCYGPELVGNVDVTSPTWAFCAMRPVVGFGHFSSHGRSESWITRGEDGAIDDIRVDCEEAGEVHITAERDAAGRIAAYHDSQVNSDVRFDYGDDDVPNSASSSTGSQTWSFDYDKEAARLLGTSSEFFSFGGHTEQADLTYETDLVSSIRVRSTGWFDCDQTIDIVRSAGRIIEIEMPGCASGTFYQATFEWEDDSLMRSQAETRVGTIETRYTYTEGRLSYLERDVEGEPSTTTWYEYDQMGRVEHIVYWGHRAPETQ